MVKKMQEVLPESGYSITSAQLNTIVTFQRLWTHLAVWMRAFIQSTVFNLPNLSAVSEKLIGLPSDFYSIFSTFYGTQIAQQFVNYLTNFIASAMNLVQSLKIGDQESVNSSTVRWYQSANELSRFLANINPFWDEVIWNNFLTQYIRLKIQEILSVIQGDYEQEINLYENIEDITFLMGRYMARGIIAASLGIVNPEI